MSTQLVKIFLFAASTINMALATTPVEDLAAGVHVPLKAMVDLLNTENYATVVPDDWCALLQKPVEEVRNWPDHVKEHVFAQISAEISILIDPEAEGSVSVELSAEVESNQLETRDDSIRNLERQALSVHNARIASGRSGCFQNWSCGTCVTAASLTGVAGITACVGTALGAEGGSAGFATPVVIAGLVECIAKVSAATTAAVGVCHTAL